MEVVKLVDVTAGLYIYPIHYIVLHFLVQPIIHYPFVLVYPTYVDRVPSRLLDNLKLASAHRRKAVLVFVPKADQLVLGQDVSACSRVCVRKQSPHSELTMYF